MSALRRHYVLVDRAAHAAWIYNLRGGDTYPPQDCIPRGAVAYGPYDSNLAAAELQAWERSFVADRVAEQRER